MITKEIDNIILSALKEDVGQGDITTNAIIPGSVKAKGVFLVKQEGIIAGLEIAERVFHLVDESVRFESLLNDGDRVLLGDIAAKIEGKASSILTAERQVRCRC